MRKTSEDTYAFNRVPKESRVSLLNVTLVRMGAATALTQFMLGSTLGHGMTFWEAMLATCLGSLVLEFVSIGLGFAGMKEGLSTGMLSRWCGFGRIGSVMIGLIIAISLIGWFGVQNSILAQSILHALDYKISFGWVAIFSGLTITFLVASGFRALTWTAKITVPLFFIVMIYIFLDLFFKDQIIQHPTNIKYLSVSQAATIVAGGFMAGALTTPDISRYCKNTSHVFWMITLCIIVGEFIINAISILIAQALNTSDIVTIVSINAGWIGLIIIILSAVKINDVNLYSSSLGLANALGMLTGKRWNYAKLTIGIGIVGTGLSVLGILNHFIDFLSMLGVIFPPIAGVMLIDYYVLRTSRNLLDETKKRGVLPNDSSIPLIGWSAIIACILGTAIGVAIKWGIPSINSIVVAGFSYWLLMKTKAHNN